MLMMGPLWLKMEFEGMVCFIRGDSAAVEDDGRDDGEACDAQDGLYES